MFLISKALHFRFCTKPSSLLSAFIPFKKQPKKEGEVNYEDVIKSIMDAQLENKDLR
jgi:hypothetical protein